jgi:hypothetical protein
MPANRQNNSSFFDYGNVANANLFTNVTGTPAFADKVKTTQQSQATPVENFGVTDPSSWDDAPKNASSSAGVGAGTANNSFNSINSDENPTPTSATNQAAINVSTASLNQLIPTQPNQLDQYASYTYAISWYVLTPQQFNDLGTGHAPNTAGWQLLMQSGGAPVKGRSPAFPLDYYLDDLEIESRMLGGGTKMANSAVDIRFKVVEPNGITLIQSLFNAVTSVYKNAQQNQANTSNNGSATSKSPTTNATPNYLQAQYCLVIEFYGYDSAGNLVAPVKGAFNTDLKTTGGYGQQAVIVKYYPFRIVDIKFQIASRAIEYTITAKPIPQSYGFTTDRGTIPFPLTMSGQTVDQLLNGSPLGGSSATNTVDPGARTNTSAPPQPDSADTALLFNDGTGYTPGYDPSAGWSI